MNANSGYSGWSMSLNAREAYESGEMPRSKWTKRRIIDAVRQFCDDNALVYDPAVEKMGRDDLFDKFIRYSGWHHTSRLFNETEFFALDEDAAGEFFRPMTEEEYASFADAKRAMQVQTAAECQARASEWEARRRLHGQFAERHGFGADTVAAFASLHPERCTYRTSRKGNEVIDYEDRYGIHTCLVSDMRHIRVLGFDATEDQAAPTRSGEGDSVEGIAAGRPEGCGTRLPGVSVTARDASTVLQGPHAQGAQQRGQER